MKIFPHTIVLIDEDQSITTEANDHDLEKQN
jgi:hypothetical protein